MPVGVSQEVDVRVAPAAGSAAVVRVVGWQVVATLEEDRMDSREAASQEALEEVSKEVEEKVAPVVRAATVSHPA